MGSCNWSQSLRKNILECLRKWKKYEKLTVSFYMSKNMTFSLMSPSHLSKLLRMSKRHQPNIKTTLLVSLSAPIHFLFSSFLFKGGQHLLQLHSILQRKCGLFLFNCTDSSQVQICWNSKNLTTTKKCIQFSLEISFNLSLWITQLLREKAGQVAARKPEPCVQWLLLLPHWFHPRNGSWGKLVHYQALRYKWFHINYFGRQLAGARF